MEMAAEDSSDLEHLKKTETAYSAAKRDCGTVLESMRANTVISSPMRKKNEDKIDKALLELSSISINEMLMEVRGLWFELDGDRGLLE